MKALLAFLMFFSSSCASLASGYPVYQILRTNVYDVTWGTGFTVAYHDRRYLITNWHVCANYKKSAAARNDLTGKVYSTNVIAEFPKDDLCLLNPVGSESLEVGSAVKQGYPVYTAGYPSSAKGKLVLRSGKTTKMSNGVLDFHKRGACLEGFTPAKDEKGTPVCDRAFVVQDTTLLGMEGCSGSPVVNSSGKLVGIVNQKNDQTLSYIPVEVLIKIMRSLESK